MTVPWCGMWDWRCYNNHLCVPLWTLQPPLFDKTHRAHNICTTSRLTFLCSLDVQHESNSIIWGKKVSRTIWRVGAHQIVGPPWQGLEVQVQPGLHYQSVPPNVGTDGMFLRWMGSRSGAETLKKRAGGVGATLQPGYKALCVVAGLTGVPSSGLVRPDKIEHWQ